MLPIEIKNLSKFYRDKRHRKIVALDGLCLEVKEGEVFGYLGPNGAGKSTTIKALVGLLHASQGTVKLFGSEVNDIQCRKRIGYLPENPSFYDSLTACEYLQLVGQVFRMEASALKLEAARVLDLLELSRASKRPIRGYSKGMVQRLGLAQTLLHDPDLYILDEPMSGLDPMGRALVKQIIRDLRDRGKTVFFSTHVTADIEAICDEVAVIVNGRICARNSVKELMKKGVEGYSIQISRNDHHKLEGYELKESPGGFLEAYVTAAAITGFMEKTVAHNIEVHLIEPKRRDLEQYFLDIVQHEKI